MSEPKEPETYVPYSIRERNRERQGQSVIYEYDELPRQLLVQIVQILDRTIGIDGRGGITTYSPSDYWPGRVWKVINEDIERELGMFQIGMGDTYRDRFASYLLSDDLSTNECIDAIEMAFGIAGNLPIFADFVRREHDIELTGEGAVRELNRRLRQHDMGYQFVDGRMVRSDSEFMHSEVVERAIVLLQHEGFERPEEEFMDAHRHYRRGEMQEAIVDASKALESMMKIALERNGVPLAGNENASVLIPKVTDRILPAHLRTQLQSLVKLMETVPSLRNKPGIAHGAGSGDRETLDSIAGYALNVTGATIVFIGERLTEQGKADVWKEDGSR